MICKKALDKCDSLLGEGREGFSGLPVKRINPSLPLHTSNHTTPKGGNLAAIPCFEHSRFKAHRHIGYVSLIAVCFLLLTVSCKTKKLVAANQRPVDSIAKKTDDKMAKLNAIRAAQTNFETFSGKAKTHLDIAGNSNDVTLNIRIKRDQKIWISITAIAGIEVVRALITPDSIMLFNRLQTYYIKQPFSYINNVVGKQANYKTVESLLVGNIIPELINENADLQTKADTLTLSGTLQDVVYKLMIGSGLKATQTNLNNQGANQSLVVTNTAFIQSGTRVVPSQIDIISLSKDKKIQLNLHYTKSDFDLPLEYPFSIPARYKEMN